MTGAKPTPLHLLAIAVLAGAVLAFEVILLRLFEFSHWHHFAGLTIALALLGLGAAGTTLSLIGRRAGRFGDRWFVFGLLLAAAGFLVVLLLHAHVSIRPLFAAWDPGELVRLLLVDFAAFVPFFGAGLVLGQVFPRWPEHPTRLYAANLVGSGVGTVGAMLLLSSMPPESAIALIATLLLAFGLAFAVHCRLAAFAAITVVVMVPAGWLAYDAPSPAVSDFKSLSRVLTLPDAEIIEQQPGLAGRLTVVRSASLRFAPGLSLNWTERVPASDAAVIGSDRIVPIERDYRQPLARARASLGGLALEMRDHGRVLALGNGTWSTAAYASGRELTWVAPDRRLLQLAAGRGARAEMIADDPYRFLATTDRSFSIISLDYVFDGADAASEDHLLTPGGLRTALANLDPDGLLAIPLKVDYPPRQGPRMLATIAESLTSFGATDPGDNVAALRGMQALLVLVSPGPLGETDIDQIERFAGQWSFDIVWHAGLSPEAANRHHRLEAPVFHESARAVFHEQPLPQEAAWFETRPASANRPYFWHAMQWTKIDELFDSQGARAASYLDWTLIMSAAAVVIVTLLATGLIIAPLGRMPKASNSFGRIRVVGYFGFLGFGFMLIEIAVLQRATILFDLPVLAAAVVFAVFMIGAGAGSAMPPSRDGSAAVARIFAMLAIGLAVMIAALWPLVPPLLALPTPARVAGLCLLLVPLTWAMGRPLPWGLQQLSSASQWLPWSWAINGFASVVAASVALLVSVQAGQSTTVMLGAGFYLGAWSIARGWSTAARRPDGCRLQISPK